MCAGEHLDCLCCVSVSTHRFLWRFHHAGMVYVPKQIQRCTLAHANTSTIDRHSSHYTQHEPFRSWDDLKLTLGPCRSTRERVDLSPHFAHPPACDVFDSLRKSCRRAPSSSRYIDFGYKPVFLRRSSFYSYPNV